MSDQVPPPVITPPVSTASSAPVAPNGTPPVSDPIAVQSSGGSSKGTLWVIVAAFIVVAVLAGSGIYLYMAMRETNPAFQQISESVQQSLDSAANDLTGVKADDDVSKDFTDVDKDLSNL